MKLMQKALLASTTLLFSIPVFADQTVDTIKQKMQKQFEMQIESVTKTPYGGLYEVVTDDTILYTDDKASFVLAGSLVDTQTLEDVTAERMKKLSAVNFSAFPLDKAIQWKTGTGANTIVTFEDPNCGYCRRLYKELKAIPDTTVYTFMLPILSADSRQKVTNIWCSKNRYETWDAWMSKGVVPPSMTKCDEPTAEVLALGRKMQVRGTPVILFANGERFNGFVSGETLKKALTSK